MYEIVNMFGTFSVEEPPAPPRNPTDSDQNPDIRQAACLAKDIAALKLLRASISVSTADASEPSQVNPYLSEARADACVLSPGEDSPRVPCLGRGDWRLAAGATGTRAWW